MEEVDAVKSDSQREQIESRLAERGPLYLDVWKLGLNTALRISDLLSLKIDDVRELDPDHPALEVVESKTGKTRRITLNRGALDVVTRRLERHPTDVWLFQSSWRARRLEPRPITRRAVSYVFAAVGDEVRPRVRLGTHSMRKTRGYSMHQAGISIEHVCKMLGHGHPAVTMRYIGIDADSIRKNYEDFVL